MNGRKTGDIFGKITSFQWNGQGVVDYVISSRELYSHITYLKVGEYSPWVSDHCPLFFKLKVKRATMDTHTENLVDLPNRFYFDDKDKAKFLESLKSSEISEKLNSLNLIEESNTEHLASGITATLLEVSEKSKLRAKKIKVKFYQNEPWFDEDCQIMKQSLKRKCRKLRKNHDDQNLKLEILEDNKKLKKLVKKKKADYKSKIMEDMKLKRNDQRIFWKLLDKLQSCRKTDSSISKISGEKWKNHFKSILQSKRNKIDIPPASLELGPLDYEINVEEMLKASYILKTNKAVGYDAICNEMIKCLIEINPTILVKLFNNILKRNVKIKEWIISIITPIHKSGVKTDPSNYRGISVMSCLGKLFSSILNLRLKEYVLTNNILCDEQLGFREGNRTSDAHIILYSLIRHYCHNNGRKLYSCFVDFKKAFDSIPRGLLFEKLLNLGVKGKFFNAIKTIYVNDNCCVKVGDKITSAFVANQGVKQGCILSPLLFNIFLSDLPKMFRGTECRPAMLNNERCISCLFWADDLVLLSESNEGIQEMISKLVKYSSMNHLEIYVEKTKAMIFNKSGRFNMMTYKLDNQFIRTTNSYKYLGFIITPSGEIHSGLKDLKVRALNAYYKLKRKMGHLFKQHSSMTLFLFEALIKPILLYASDFWGCLKMPKNNPIENVHIRFCKDILGVQKQTTNVGVLLELGEIPITIFAKKNCIKNYIRINVSKRANNILTASVQIPTVTLSPWLSAVKNCSNNIGIGTPLDKSAHQKAFIRMKDIFHQESFTDIHRSDSKLRTYGEIKTVIGIEKYLLTPQVR